MDSGDPAGLGGSEQNRDAICSADAAGKLRTATDQGVALKLASLLQRSFWVVQGDDRSPMDLRQKADGLPFYAENESCCLEVGIDARWVVSHVDGEVQAF